MSSNEIKLGYSSTALRIRAEISKAACLATDKPPEDVLMRAKSKMEQVKQKGSIGFYLFNQEGFYEAWNRMRASDTPDDLKVMFTVAEGAPNLAGLEITFTGTSEKDLLRLTIKARKETVNKWRFDWVKAHIKRVMREKKRLETPHWGQVHAAFLRAYNGERIKDLVIAQLPAQGDGKDRSFSLIASKKRMEVTLVVRDLKVAAEPDAQQQILMSLDQLLSKMSSPDTNYTVRKRDIVATIEAAKQGPEVIGIDTPLTVLAAIGVKKAAPNDGPYPGLGKMQIRVSSDKMTAEIDYFDVAFYKEFKVDADWVQKEMRRLYLAPRLNQKAAAAINKAAAAKENLDGIVVAEGVPGKGGTEPYLHAAFKDVQTKVQEQDGKQMDLREMQAGNTVKPGQLVAEIRYKSQAKKGMNVFGESLAPPPNDDLTVRVGDGIQARGVGKYYATEDGVPIVEEETVRLETTYLHEGNINLKSGNVRFKGDVEVTGNIEQGAVVEVTGNLEVHGSIEGATVRVGGNLICRSGLNAQDMGSVRVRGDAEVEFIEHSRIICGGNIRVKAAILNSTVIAGKEIQLLGKTSVAAGGYLSCWGSLRTVNLGFTRGERTKVFAGVDWRIQESITIRERRIEKVTAKQQEDRQALRELLKKKGGQVTEKHEEKKKTYQARLQKARKILEKSDEHLAAAKARLTYNEDCRIYVSETLVSTCDIQIGGKSVTVVHDVSGVVVLPKRRRGSHILPIEQIQEEEAREKELAAS